MHDRTEDARALKWLSIVDEHTWECLALEVRRSFTSADVIEVLKELFLIRGTLEHVRSDNGPEFIAGRIVAWLSQAKVPTLYIEPGSPWENGCVESFHGCVRNELLESELFMCLAEARRLSGQWRWEYHHRRPHSSLGYVAPAREATAGNTLITSGTGIGGRSLTGAIIRLASLVLGSIGNKSSCPFPAQLPAVFPLWN